MKKVGKGKDEKEEEGKSMEKVKVEGTEKKEEEQGKLKGKRKG